MTSIRVTPSVLKEEARKISVAAAELGSAASQLASAGSYIHDPITWIQLGARIRGLAGDAHREGRALSSLLDSMSATLAARATAFDVADNASASGLTYAFQFGVLEGGSLLDFLRDLAHLPEEALEIILSLGGLLGLGVVPGTLITALAPGLAQVGQSLTSYVSELDKEDFAEAVNWFDRFLSPTLKGKTKVGSRWPFAADVRRNPARHFKDGTTGNFLLGSVLEFLEHPEDWTVHGGAVALTKGILEKGISEGIGWEILLANMAVQAVFTVSIWGMSEHAKFVSLDPEMDQLVDDQAELTQEKLEQLDIGNVTRAAAVLAVDWVTLRTTVAVETTLAMWQEPSIEHAVQLSMLTAPGLDAVTLNCVDPEGVTYLEGDAAELLGSVLDFGKGLYEFPFEYGGLIAYSGIAYGKGLVDGATIVCDEGLVDGAITIGNTVFEQLFDPSSS